MADTSKNDTPKPKLEDQIKYLMYWVAAATMSTINKADADMWQHILESLRTYQATKRLLQDAEAYFGMSWREFLKLQERIEE